MNLRDKLSAASLLVTLGVVVTPGGASQIPDSLAWIGLPDDPTELPGLVAAGQRPARDIFKVGCPSDGGWAGAAFEALLEAAEGNILVRRSLISALGSKLGYGDRWGGIPKCAAEIPRYEAWLAERLRREWRAGVLTIGSGRPTLYLDLLVSLDSSKNPATHGLVSNIAKDSTVYEDIRSLAARFMVDHRFGASMTGRDPLGNPATRERYLDAYQAVLFELATGPPLPEFEANVQDILRHRRGESFDREYERVLTAAGRIRR